MRPRLSRRVAAKNSNLVECETLAFPIPSFLKKPALHPTLQFFRKIGGLNRPLQMPFSIAALTLPEVAASKPGKKITGNALLATSS